ncbi:MAG TPA: sulfatase [Candidatus Saccharimonadales bacterium]|nr:sulfatase [Candidatus Saccharimonadales bacterium]
MRRTATTAAVALLVLAPACSAIFPPRQKPQRCFVILVIDSLRADHVGTYGYGRDTTPAIDALSRDGVTFTSAWSQAPWTKPSVASLFTSTYPSVHRVLYSKVIVNGEDRSDVLSGKFTTLAEAMKEAGYATAAFGKKIHLRPQYGFSQGFDAYDMNAGDADRINDAVTSWLRSEDPDRFFLYLHYNDVHYPYEPLKEGAVFGGGKPRVEIDGETKRAFRKGELKLTDEDVRQQVNLYDDEILFTDRHVGDLMRSFEERGYSNVLVAVTADHGEEFLDHGDITHGQSLYNELLRVPLVLGGSGVPEAVRGKRVAPAVQLIDLMPTFLDLAGAQRPPLLQGRSIADFLLGREPALPGEPAFSQRRDLHETEFSRCVFDGRWKLIIDASGGRTLLFNESADPGEHTSLTEREPGVVDSLMKMFQPWREANDALHDAIRPEDTTPLDPKTEEQLRSLGYVD